MSKLEFTEELKQLLDVELALADTITIQEGVDSVADELMDYITGKRYVACSWSRTVNNVHDLLSAVMSVLSEGSDRPVWCKQLHFEVIRRYLQIVQRISPVRVKPCIPKMHEIQSLINEYYRILPTLNEGVTKMSTTNNPENIQFTKPIPEGFADMTDVLNNPDVVISSKITSDYGDRGVIVEPPPRVVPPANLRKDPAYLLYINGCGRVAFRFKESPFGWINQLSIHIDIAGLDENVRDHVLEVLRSIIIVPFENFEGFEEDSIVADNQLAEFIKEVEVMNVVERPLYSNGVFFMSIIPTVRQSWDVEEHEKPV